MYYSALQNVAPKNKNKDYKNIANLSLFSKKKKEENLLTIDTNFTLNQQL